MSRLLLPAAATLLLGAAAGAWWWWTAPPAGRCVDLAAAAAEMPPAAEGVLVVAQGRRLTRWVARHPAAALLALVAAPDASAALDPLRPVLPPVLRTARGPLAVWWGESGGGLSATVLPSDLAGLRQLAALEGLGWAEEGVAGGAVRLWVFRGLPPSREGPAHSAGPPAEGSCAALARVHGRWWRLHLTRAGLTAESGAPPGLPECRGESVAVTSRLARLLTGDERPAAPASTFLIAADGGWAVGLGPTASPGPLDGPLRALAGRSPAVGDPPVTSWASPFGRFYLSRGAVLAVATDPALLARLPAPEEGAEWGCLRGREAAGALAAALPLLDRLPGMPPRARLGQAVEHLRAVELCAWRVEPSGGRVAVRW